MYGLNLADNITRLRHARKITQEELADFLGVTKASVSKWENAQSTPDLLMLLGLSAFFDVTVDMSRSFPGSRSAAVMRNCPEILQIFLLKRPSGKPALWHTGIIPVIRSCCSWVFSIGTTLCWQRQRRGRRRFFQRRPAGVTISWKILVTWVCAMTLWL